jgi:hypothetical protein
MDEPGASRIMQSDWETRISGGIDLQKARKLINIVEVVWACRGSILLFPFPIRWMAGWFHFVISPSHFMDGRLVPF